MKYIQKSGKIYKPTKQGKQISLAPQNVYKLSKNKIKFWENLAKEGIDWIEPWKTAYKKEGKNHFSWFKEGKLNLCYNAVDRHLKKPDKPAIIFVPENPKEKKQTISYYKLFEMVNQAAALLIKKGVKKGDLVIIYMPMIPETLIFMLACARIGAIHSIIFSAFSAEILGKRIKKGNAKVLISSDYYFRKGKKINLLKKANLACKGNNIKKIIVKRKKAGRFFSKSPKQKPTIIKPEPMNAEDTAFILYTSGTTGKSKGGVMQAIGGYTVQAYWSSKYLFNLKENEVMWCTADVGWITGHTYTCYGPLLNNATTLIYEGLLNYPNPNRYLKIIKENKVNVFYTAPTLIRLLALHGSVHTKKFSNNSLKILGSVGEPIDEQAWNWFFENIGKKRLPVIDTYWQTETGSVVVSSLPGVGPFKPTYTGLSFPGIEHEVIDEKGEKVKPGNKGLLVQVPPFCPSLTRGLWKHEKEYQTFFKHGYYLTGDNAFKLKNGMIRILGRADDIIKVAGHRMSTAEIESAISTLPAVAEAAIVAKPDKIKGEVPVAFIKTKPTSKTLKETDIINTVNKQIGPIAKPKEVYFIKDLPKTRSGKIIRAILKKLAAGESVKKPPSIANPKVIDEIKRVISSLSPHKNP